MFRYLLCFICAACVAACDAAPDTFRPDEPPGHGGVRGSGNVVTESREIDTFRRLEFTGVGHLVLEQTGSPSLTVTAEDNIQEFLESRVVGDTLHLGVAANTDELDVLIAGATSVTIAGRAVRQVITVRGASTYDAGQLESRDVNVDVTGASRAIVRASGTVHARTNFPSSVVYIGNPSVHVDGPAGTVVQQ